MHLGQNTQIHKIHKYTKYTQYLMLTVSQSKLCNLCHNPDCLDYVTAVMHGDQNPDYTLDSDPHAFLLDSDSNDQLWIVSVDSTLDSVYISYKLHARRKEATFPASKTPLQKVRLPCKETDSKFPRASRKYDAVVALGSYFWHFPLLPSFGFSSADRLY